MARDRDEGLNGGREAGERERKTRHEQTRQEMGGAQSSRVPPELKVGRSPVQILANSWLLMLFGDGVQRVQRVQRVCAHATHDGRSATGILPVTHERHSKVGHAETLAATLLRTAHAYIVHTLPYSFYDTRAATEH